MYNILLVEDSPDFQFLISKTLNKIAKNFTICSTYQEALPNIQNKNFDVILLDVGLPDGDGFTICQELQNSPKTSKIPVFFITGNNDPSAVVEAFSLGAEDIITKPFEPTVLAARIESRLSKLNAQKVQDEVFEIEDLLIDLPQMKAFLRGTEKNADLMLTPIEFKLLYQLARAENQVFSREQLLRSVWGENVNVFGRNVDVQLSSLRRKLGKFSKCIQAVPGVGYCFNRHRQSKNPAA